MPEQNRQNSGDVMFLAKISPSKKNGQVSSTLASCKGRFQ
jgi:hypothetical protein